ncbi:Transposon TX1 uncharacterized 149 kDa protein ORF 2 [Takifugu flavidus]|uniref:Transposon TX1 uncharacterized 149 kDa protein ORF 2 n=1 Tax=Takifugu flavidus TaxID=433684 RepID=A0A5C6P2L4_9TELE|nr:Transposon TX1 uncharacterized 149 kDa protein ORF 2 [Takifugu flavidus]
MHTFRVGTLNVNGARDAKKRALVFDTAKRKRVDVMFLQETHSDRNNEADWEKEWEGQALLSHNTSLSGGVGLLFSKSFAPSSLEVEHVVSREKIRFYVLKTVVGPWKSRDTAPVPAVYPQCHAGHTQVDQRSGDGDSGARGDWQLHGDRGCIETLQSKKMALASLLDNQVQGALVRSRIQDITEMDAPSSFFFGLERRRGQNQMIHSLFSSTGQELVEPGQIRRRAVEFFSSLYETEYCGDDGLFDEFCGGLPRQGVLYLPREEGGQGLIHLASRTAAFRIQFVQRFLTGPADLMWRDVARCVFRRVSNLGLDDALFLTDFKFAKLNGLPPFYQSVVKAWALFKVEKRTSSESLYWLLREPTVHGARLDVSAEAPPRLTAALWRTRTLLLQHVVAVAGPDLTGAEAVGSLLGIRSTQAAEGVLRLWRNRLSTRERRILEDYGQGAEPDSEDPFPEIRLVAHLGNLDGPLLRPAKAFSLAAIDKKTIYNNCVRVLNRRGLSNRNTSVWADRLGGDGARPCWRVLYKPPLKKRTGDLQWRILHGAVALNALLSKMNNAVSDRLFIFGAGYKKAARNKWQLLNFICGEAKMAIYISRKNKMAKSGDWEAASVWRCNVRSRLRWEFDFYRMINDLDKFQEIWCHENVLCTVIDNRLVFAQPLVG